MQLESLSEIRKIWDDILRDKSWSSYAVDYNIHKKMFLTFQPGPCYCWILNIKESRFEMMSPEAEKVLGYLREELTFEFLFSLIHPEDLPHVLNFESGIMNFFNKLPNEKRWGYKIQYDFRVKRADGEYIRLLNQMVIVQYNGFSNNVLTFGVQTDITHLKKEVRPVLSFIALEARDPSYIDVSVAKVYKPAKSILSKREKEVLGLILDGMVSKEICDKLHISKLTVDTHRKHILEKTRSRSIPEMIKKAIVNGWV